MIKRFRFFLLIGLGVIIITAIVIFFLSKLKPKELSHPAGHIESIQNNIVTINPEQLQSIGVTFATVEKRLIEKEIRTVGRVEVDERKITSVNIKVAGWIEKLMVNYTGEHVKKGDILFTIYSPELVATEQEYLLALQAAKKLKGSKYQEVSQGATSLLDVTRQRLQLWDIAEEHIQKIAQTGQVEKILPKSYGCFYFFVFQKS